MQVGCVRGQPSGPGHRLVESGVDAPVWPDFGQEGVGVGGAQLFDFPVTQDGRDYRVFVPQLLERLVVGRIPGLRLLARRQAELAVEDLAQLLDGIDEERAAGQLVDLALKGPGLVGQHAPQAGELDGVDPHADQLHPGQHPDQRPLHLVVEARHAPRRQRRGQRGRPAGRRRRLVRPPRSAGSAVT